MRILLVEDNESDVFFFREALREVKVEVDLIARSRGDIALAYLQEERPKDALPDLLVIDLNLPRISGLELLNNLKDDPKLSRIPAIILSSSAAAADIRTCYRRGARAYLVKPMNFDDLVQMVVSIVGFWSCVSLDGAAEDW